MSKDKKRRALVTKEESRLVLKSSIIKRFPNVERILANGNDVIYCKDIEQLVLSDKDTYDTLMYGFEEIKDTASKEWVQAGYQGNFKAKCQLCGYSRLKHVYKIKNNTNGSSLIVGSECIEKFPNMDNKILGIDIKEYSKLIAKSEEKVSRLKIFYNIYPNGISKIDKWKEDYNNLDLVMPKEIDDGFKNLFKRSTKFYRGFINGKIDQQELLKFKSFQKEFDYYMRSYESFKQHNIYNKFVCDRIIKQWLLNNNREHILEKISIANGIITKDIIVEVYSSSFINRFKDEIKAKFKTQGLSLKDIGEEKIVFSFKYKTFTPTILEISPKEFVNRFACVFYNLDKVIEINSSDKLLVQNKYVNIYEFSGIIEDKLKKYGYNFKFDEDMHKKQIIELYKKGYNKYSVINIRTLISEFTMSLFLSDKDSEEYLLQKINSNCEWLDKAMKDKYKVTEADIAGVYKNK